MEFGGWEFFRTPAELRYLRSRSHTSRLRKRDFSKQSSEFKACERFSSSRVRNAPFLADPVLCVSTVEPACMQHGSQTEQWAVPLLKLNSIMVWGKCPVEILRIPPPSRTSISLFLRSWLSPWSDAWRLSRRLLWDENRYINDVELTTSCGLGIGFDPSLRNLSEGDDAQRDSRNAKHGVPRQCPASAHIIIPAAFCIGDAIRDDLTPNKESCSGQSPKLMFRIPNRPTYKSNRQRPVFHAN